MYVAVFSLIVSPNMAAYILRNIAWHSYRVMGHDKGDLICLPIRSSVFLHILSC